MREIERLGKKPYVKVGYPHGTFDKEHKDKDGHPGKETVGQIAVKMEFGDPPVPARSFVRATHDLKKGEWLKLTVRIEKQIMAGKMTVKQGLDMMGLRIQSDIRKYVKKGIPPPLALSTLYARTRGKKWKALSKGRGPVPLIDTGQLINEALTFKTIMDGKE